VGARPRRRLDTRAPHGRRQHAPAAEGAGGAARPRQRSSGVSSRQSLSSPPGFQLPSLGGLADGIDAVGGEQDVIELTYHDTPHLRLARAGATLLYSADDGWLVTLGRGSAADPERPRHEYRFEGHASEPPAAALDLVRALVRTSKVGPVARLRTRRRPVDLRDASGKTLGEGLDDEVALPAGGRGAARRAWRGRRSPRGGGPSPSPPACAPPAPGRPIRAPRSCGPSAGGPWSRPMSQWCTASARRPPPAT